MGIIDLENVRFLATAQNDEDDGSNDGEEDNDADDDADDETEVGGGAAAIAVGARRAAVLSVTRPKIGKMNK